jgi:hypothetical protein
MRFIKIIQNKNSTCADCGKEIKNLYLFENGKVYGVECAKKLLFGEDYIKIFRKEKEIKKVYDLCYKNKIIIRTHNKDEIENLKNKIITIRGYIPTIKEKEVIY